jgi:hypothetical protein
MSNKKQRSSRTARPGAKKATKLASQGKVKTGTAAKRKGKPRPEETPAIEPEMALPSFMIEWERAYKQFHEEIDKAIERAYKCNPSCQGFEKCQWRMHLFHVLDLEQAIRDVTRVVKKFHRGSRQRGKKPTELVRKAIQIKSENKGRTCRQILADEHPHWNELKPKEQEAEVIKLRDNLRQARKRTKARLKGKGE